MKTVTRKTKKRERPLGVAAASSLIISLVLGLVISVILISTPRTSEYYYFQLVAYNYTGTLPSTPLYQSLLAQIHRDDALYVIPATLLGGGIALGLLAPRSAGRLRTLRTGAIVAASVLGLYLAFLYSVVIIQAAQYKQPRHLDVHGVLMECLGIPIWAAICALGALIGMALRDARHKKAGQTPTPQAVSAASR